MPKGRFKKSDREIKIQMELGKGLILLANLAAGSLLFGQAVSDEPFNFGLAGFGTVLVIWLYSLSVWVMKGGGKLK